MPSRLAPPQFQGFDPQGNFTFYQRHLPHWRQTGATYFVTFRLADSLPQETIDFIRRMRREIVRLGSHPSAIDLRNRLEQDVSRRFEGSLDEGHGKCLLADSKNAKILYELLQHGCGNRYFLGCSVVMPNHCHVMVRPNEGFDLEKVLGAVKGFSAKQINHRMGTTGVLWQEECYDRIVRDEEHLYRVLQYIGRNRSKCGLSNAHLFRWVNPLWQEAGWDYEDVMAPLFVPPD